MQLGAVAASQRVARRGAGQDGQAIVRWAGRADHLLDAPSRDVQMFVNSRPKSAESFGPTAKM